MLKRVCCVVFVMLTVSACTSRYSSNGDNIYLKSHNGARIQVPPPLTSANISNFYDLPPQTQDAKVTIAPPVE